MQMKLIFARNVLHLASFWKWGFWNSEVAHCKYSNGMYISQQPSDRNKKLYVPSYLLAYCYFILLERFHLKSFLGIGIERFRMTPRRPYWCPKTMKRWPCWCPKPVLWELNSFLMQTLSFVPRHLHRCWPREWKHSIYCIPLETSND